MANIDVFYIIKQWNHRAEQWMARHFYFLLFELFLIIIFIVAFINVFKIINACFFVHKDSAAEQLLLVQSINSELIVMLLILIALGVLNIINNNTRLRGVMKNIEFNLSKRRNDSRPPND